MKVFFFLIVYKIKVPLQVVYMYLKDNIICIYIYKKEKKIQVQLFAFFK